MARSGSVVLMTPEKHGILLYKTSSYRMEVAEVGVKFSQLFEDM